MCIYIYPILKVSHLRQFGMCPFRRSRPAASPSPPGHDFSNLLVVSAQGLSAEDRCCVLIYANVLMIPV